MYIYNTFEARAFSTDLSLMTGSSKRNLQLNLNSYNEDFGAFSQTSVSFNLSVSLIKNTNLTKLDHLIYET